MKTLIAVLVASLAVSASAAAPSFAGRKPLAPRTVPQDVFASCAAFTRYETTAQRGPTLDEAVNAVTRCLNDYYRQSVARRTWTVGALRSLVSYDAKTHADVEGVVLTLSGAISAGSDDAKADLEFSIQKRQGRLLGWPASVADGRGRALGDCGKGPC